MMLNGDVRNNYVMTGATWTAFGLRPAFGNHVGTSRMANTTMETYQQGGNTTSSGGSTNCLTCHVPQSTSDPVTGVSHILMV
jgi:hypothetical protein